MKNHLHFKRSTHIHDRSDPKQQSRQQRGAALIIVLGLVALISTWAIDALYEDNIALRRAENSDNALRAEQASQSALILSAQILIEDMKDSQSDDLDEAWAQEAQAFPIDDGIVQGLIIDTARLLNLNDLVDKNGIAKPPFETTIKALFTQLDLDATLVDALIDWMDHDSQNHGTNGAEDSSYYDRDYHVKNARMDRWHELLLIRGFDADIVAKLVPYCIVGKVPSIDISTININTASAQVLMARIPNITLSDAEMFIADRPYQSISKASQSHPWLTGASTTGLSVISNIFMVRTQATFGRVNLREIFMLERQAGTIKLLSLERRYNYQALPSKVIN